LLIGRISRCREEQLFNPPYREESNSLPKLSHKQINIDIQGGNTKNGFKVRTRVNARREGQKKNKLN
jgi:hypothetical protein